jgi:glycosyltransferase involved in cell wall biosynthesis
MIIFILNGYFLDNAGFSKRCQKEVKMLSQHQEIIIISRDNKEAHGKYNNKNVTIINFTVNEALVENPKNYKTGFYEIYRNMKLFLPLMTTLFRIIKTYRKEKLTVYVVSSPMTVPLFCFVIIKLFGVSNTVLEFHDLEPEMAITIKKLKKTNLILKIEYLLEKFLCKHYAKIIVTTQTQKEVIQQRTHIEETKIFSLPNTINNTNVMDKETKNNFHIASLKKDDFVIGYISSMTFEYTVTAVCSLLKEMLETFRKYPTIKFLIIGDGDMLYKIRETITKYKLEKQVILTGKIQDAAAALQRIDVGIIPLVEDAHTRTVIPTRLFEYFAAKKPIIVPDFASFKEIIIDQTNGLLYTSITDLKEKIMQLKLNIKEKNSLAENGYVMFLKQYQLQNYYQAYINFLNL